MSPRSRQRCRHQASPHCPRGCVSSASVGALQMFPGCLQKQNRCAVALSLPTLAEQLPESRSCPAQPRVCAGGEREGGRDKIPGRQTAGSSRHRGEVTALSHGHGIPEMGWCGETFLWIPSGCPISQKLLTTGAALLLWIPLEGQVCETTGLLRV